MTDRNPKKDPKENADVPPVLPSEQPTGSDGGGVLNPEELDITESPYVAEVSDGRYVVSADRTPPNPKPDSQSGARSASVADSHEQPETVEDTISEPTPSGGTTKSAGHNSPGAARSVLAAELERTNARYAVDIVSRLEGADVRHRTTSEDIVGTFDNLVLWYAQNVATETPTQRTATLLLDRSEFSAPLSPQQIRRTAKQHGLTRSSTIGDLLDALD